MEAAYEQLRKRGLAAAARKASRLAVEGLVGLGTTENSLAMVEINSETDFVARNERFISLVQGVTRAVLGMYGARVGADHQLDVHQVGQTLLEDGLTVLDACQQTSAEVGENIQLRRAYALTSPWGVSSYLHRSVAPGVGRIASAIVIEPQEGSLSAHNLQRVHEAGSELAMHVAGLEPLYLSRADIPQEVLTAARQKARGQALEEGVPEAHVDKVVEGRLAKYYEELCLLDQKYVTDEKRKVQDVLDHLSHAVGVRLRVSQFLRVECGRGLK